VNVTPMLDRLSAYDAYRWAVDLFEERDYYAAAEVLQHLVDTHPHESELGAARELLARSYFHSAQAGRAAETARDLLDRDPSNAYAALLLTRSLQRSARPEEAAAAQRVADALGAGS
jgi:cytochrome c-type biogenesis protein CcmH/NrfG